MNESPDQARCMCEGGGGFEIVQSERWVWCFDRRTRGPLTGELIAAGVAFILLVNAVVMVATALAGDMSWIVALIELGGATLAGGIAWLFDRLRKRRASAPRSSLRPLAILDLQEGTLLDGQRRVIAPLAQVRAERAMLVTSSAPALVLRPPSGPKIEVFRGALWGGGLDEARELFRRFGLRT